MGDTGPDTNDKHVSQFYAYIGQPTHRMAKQMYRSRVERARENVQNPRCYIFRLPCHLLKFL